MDVRYFGSSAQPLASSCRDCGLLAWSQSKETNVLPAHAAAKFNELITHSCSIPRGKYLNRAGFLFKSVYVLRNGFLKTTIVTRSGLEQVTGFVMPGDPVGMDGIGSGKHVCNTVALEDSQLCGISFDELERLCCEIPPLQRNLHRILGKEITQDYGLMLLLGAMHAEQRFAMFLLNLSARYAARNFSPTHFRLYMTRAEIGSYIGLRLETISRLFTGFSKYGLITVTGKHIQIKSLEGLEQKIHKNDVPRWDRLISGRALGSIAGVTARTGELLRNLQTEEG